MRIVLIDDHEIVRIGLRDFLRGFREHEVIGEAGTAREAFPLIDSGKPDIVLMDLVLPGMDGVLATREVLRRVSTARIVILSAHEQRHDVIDAMDAGAAAYVLKSEDPATLIQAIEIAARGGRYVTPRLAEHVFSERHARLERDEVLAALSSREREIFRMATEGRLAREIARDLCLARKTVDTHLNRIHRKLGLRNQAELVRLAFSIGLVHSVRANGGSGH
jgi:DNA-binding NarL/FixJ family response regulator